MLKIILDTNFLLIPFLYKVDIFAEIKRIIDDPYEIFIVEDSKDELKNIINTQKGKDKQAALLALKLIDKKALRTLKQKSLYMTLDSKNLVVDDIILGLADSNTIVATQDKALKNKLQNNNIKTIILRGKKYLVLN